jgi:hypothetical protein
VPAASRVVEVAREIEAADRDFAVVDETGRAIGVINRSVLMEVFLDGGTAGRASD